MNTSDKPLAAIYIRVSSSLQEDNGSSLATQEASCRVYAGENGYAVSEIHVYREVRTGVELWERGQLSALREAIRQREVDVLIVYAVDRLSRNPTHLGLVLSEAEHTGVGVHFVSERPNASLDGQIVGFMRGYPAEVEQEKFRERSQRGRRARVESGMPLPGPRPLYGYHWRDSKKSGYEIDGAKAAVVRRIFRETAGGATLKQIALALMADGIPTPTKGSLWRTDVIADILGHPAYSGRAAAYRYRVEKLNGRRTVHESKPEARVPLPPRVIPPLVDEPMFDAVQEVLLRNKARTARCTKHPETYLLRGGIARCGYCGVSLHAGWGNDKPAYVCGANKHESGRCPNPPNILAAMLDTAVWDEVGAHLTQTEHVAAALARLRERDSADADLATVHGALADVETKQGIVSRAIAMLDSTYTEPLVRELSALSEQKRRLEAERKKVLARRKSWQTTQRRLAELLEHCQAKTSLGRLSYSDRRLLLKVLNIRVKVWKANHVPRWLVTGNISEPLDEMPQLRTKNDSRARPARAAFPAAAPQWPVRGWSTWSGSPGQ